ncbi:hypothetical protein Lal_00027266 [Lupinus albus]|nr:hypothetical protein Lal_00027266 [Lupinus albus]
MVERWRQETHSFHFPNGECIITLQDVAYQLAIPIDGKAITEDTSMDWEDLCLQLLGKMLMRTGRAKIWSVHPQNDRRIPHAGSMLLKPYRLSNRLGYWYSGTVVQPVVQ